MVGAATKKGGQREALGQDRRRYGQICNHVAKANIGRIKLHALRASDIEDYLDDARAHGARNGKPLSERTVLHHFRLLSLALQDAVDDRPRLLTANPAKSRKLTPRPNAAEIVTLDESQARELLRASRGTEFEIPVLLAYGCGLRRGEVLALRWSDVDLKNGTLAVTRSVVQTSEGITFKEPKSRKARVVALPVEVVEALREHRKAQAAQRLRAESWTTLNLVCATATGDVVNPDNFSQRFTQFVKANPKLPPRFKFHGLRHTHATDLLRLDVHPKIVSERLGHSKIGITLDTYSHVIPTMQRDAAERFNSVLGAVLGSG